MKENSKKAKAQGDGNAQQSTVKDKSTPMTKQQYSLYVRGAAWIKDRDNAENRLKQLAPAMHGVRYPRQKSANYCFIDFASASDRDQSYEKLKKNSEIRVKLSTKDLPKLLDKRRQQIADKREAKSATKKLIKKIVQKEKSAKFEKTNQIVIMHLPEKVTQVELKAHYPNAIKVSVKDKARGTKTSRIAIITFAEARDAFAASKEESFNLHGQKINVVLNTNKLFKNKAKKKPTNGKTKQKITEKNPKPENE